MLFVDVAEALNDRRDPARHAFLNRVMGPVSVRIGKASAFVLDPNATSMGVSVFLSRPSSMLAALPFVRLPAENVWMEFSNIAAREALASLGNDNAWAEGGVLIKRTGFLLTMEDEIIRMEAVAEYTAPDGRPLPELFTTICTFDTSARASRVVEPIPIVPGGPLRSNSTGRARRYLEMVTRDPKEIAARAELEARFDSTVHPDYDVVVDRMSGMGGMSAVAKAAVGHKQDMYRMFTMQILPTLILMNCRNAVSPEFVAAPEKLNKARRRKGRPEIGPYHIVRLHLGPRRHYLNQSGDPAGTRARAQGGMVIGHFKVRKTGVFYWSNHWRGDPSTSVRRVTVVTP